MANERRTLGSAKKLGPMVSSATTEPMRRPAVMQGKPKSSDLSAI